MAGYGVSPAFFLSRFSHRFSWQQVAAALPGIRSLGYDRVELEIFHPERLAAWERGGMEAVSEAAEKSGLVCSQFVAHFLLHAFEAVEAVLDPWGLAECERLVLLLDRVGTCPVVTVPLPSFRPGTAAAYRPLLDALAAKLRTMAELVEGSGRRLAVEVMPGALVSASDGYLRLRDALSRGQDEGQNTGRHEGHHGDEGETVFAVDLGYNFDTGHAWAQGEPVWLLPSKLHGSITGTHLCDNHGGTNDSLCPGDGTIRWQDTVSALRESGYAGSLDIEIKCHPPAVERQYARGLEFIREIEAGLSPHAPPAQGRPYKEVRA